MKSILIILITISFLVAKEYTNSLINSNSPYLLQHAHNPINWYEWNEQVLSKAKKENKLIFLSIGYSTCHWCHVMEKESFENEALAKIFNKHYISIKVDREIQSDLDLYYQEKLTALKTRRNGWPLSVILSPDLDVLYIATYIPPYFNYGVEGLDTLLLKYADIYKNKKVLTSLLSKNKHLINQSKQFSKKKISNLQEQIIFENKKVYDTGFKGFFKNPRFPHSSNLTLLYDIYGLSGNKEVLKMVIDPLVAMANGGIYDQIEGAFFRYSVHQDWIVPHFEKMLYTTAELIPLYVRAYKDTKNPLFKKVVTESLGEIENRFLEDGLFFSASNADTDGKEGRYFVYSYEEVEKELLKLGMGENEIEENLLYLDIGVVGNFEDEFSNPHFNNNYEEDPIPEALQTTIKVLNDIRKKREYPFIDKKTIVSWNAMMIKAFLDAGSINPHYSAKGLNYLDVLLATLIEKDQLYHYKIGNHPLKQKAILEDYAFLSETLLDAYFVTYEKRYLELALVFSKQARLEFFKDGKWFLSDGLVEVEGNFIDKYYTSALAKMLWVNITLASLTYDRELFLQTKQEIMNYKDQILSDIAAHPSGMKLLLRLEKEDIVLKASKKNLLGNKKFIEKINYPFLFTKVEDTNQFLACDRDSCFGFNKDIEKTKEIIEKRVGN